MRFAPSGVRGKAPEKGGGGGYALRYDSRVGGAAGINKQFQTGL